MWEIIHLWQPLTDYKLSWLTSTGEIWTKILLLLLSYSFWICIFSQVKERSKKVQSWCINIYDILYILKMLYIFWEISILTFDSWLNYFMKTKLEEAKRLCLSLKKKIKNDLDSLVVWNLYQAQQMQMQRRQVVLQLNKFWQIHFPIPSNSNTNQQIHTHVTLAITIPNSPKYQTQTPKYTVDIGKYISQFPQIPNINPRIHMWYWQIHFLIPPNTNLIQTNNYTCHIGNCNSLSPKYQTQSPK